MQDIFGSDGGNLGKSLAVIACNIDAYRHLIQSQRLRWTAGCTHVCGSLSLSGRRLKDGFRTRMEKIRKSKFGSPKHVLAFPHMLSRLPVVHTSPIDQLEAENTPAPGSQLKNRYKDVLVSDNAELDEKVLGEQPPESSQPKVVCSEVTNGRRKLYLEATEAKSGQFITEEEAESNVQKARAFLAGYLLPQGYPESVAPQYSGYMTWRGVQYCFGGAISVFTTRSLLSSLGIAGRRSGETAAAINWVLKDGAGRLGKFLFARWGRALDCELKQFRLLGDILMESGAALELYTVTRPGLFLPLACSANLAKNLAAVAASSTRAPIYRTFALQNNMADVTSKGESVANMADIFGTILGICLSKAKLPLHSTFCALSAGYLVASRKEIDSVELPYYNRARLAVATRVFLESGKVPGIAKANKKEALLPWGKDCGKKIELGASIAEAFQHPAEYRTVNKDFLAKPYLLSYRPDTKKVQVVLREKATAEDCLEATFHAHLFLYLLSSEHKGALLHLRDRVTKSRDTNNNQLRKQKKSRECSIDKGDWKSVLAESKSLENLLYQEFRQQSMSVGWRLHETMLNPKDSRLLGTL